MRRPTSILLAAAVAAAAGPAAAGPRRGVPRPAGVWCADDESPPAADPDLPPFAALVAGDTDADVPAVAGEVALHPAIARGALPRPVVDTARSFTVAAWVRLDDLDVDRAVAVAQPGGQVSAYTLGYVDGNFALSVTYGDFVLAPERHAWAAARPIAGEWAHLVGIFDEPGSQLRLYVDGHLQAVAPALKMWSASGTTSVGRGLLEGETGGHWPGEIEDVRVFATALTAANVLALFDEQPGSGGEIY